MVAPFIAIEYLHDANLLGNATRPRRTRAARQPAQFAGRFADVQVPLPLEEFDDAQGPEDANVELSYVNHMLFCFECLHLRRY